MCFFIYAIDNPSHQPKVLPQIQLLLNNTPSFTIEKTLNEITYKFSPKRPLDLCLAVILPNTYVTCTEASDVISFILANLKKYYNRYYQLLFIQIEKWAMFKLYKSYLILSFIGVIKKLTQQDVGSFQIVKKVGRLAYKLDILSNQRIYPVFFIVQLEPAPNSTKDPFQHFCLQ